MGATITSGQASDLEAKIRLREAKMIEGPGVAGLHRGHGYRELISKIFRYSFGWSDLQWTSENIFGLPTAINAQWNDGTRPTDPAFLGESGGCIYNVFFPHGSRHNELSILRPPSERTGRQVSQFILKIDFPIRAVAIDATLKEVVLLERFLFIFFMFFRVSDGPVPPTDRITVMPFFISTTSVAGCFVHRTYGTQTGDTR